ncbi:nuclear-pore anchor [Cynara cardunculus var. scolymus]|uniref:nuclear-pore anchor n=1 Tax=Cynara cardunculus var. scolymus TaxID=59895 RepID=UPI000D625EA1|nr:nuclear-pore anchor [Cynara cardunculus var. scolymus]XP_024989706.1 nuclear-pore anchor [Cynara cardunculus var. scolymus]
MTLFLSDEEYARCSHDPSLIAQKADAYIRELYNQLETEKAQYDASSITAEQTCSLLEQKYVSLKSEFSALQSQYSQLNSTLEERGSELAQIQADKHQVYLQSIGKDGEIERLSLEASELHKSKSQLLQLIEHKDLEINEKNATIKGYLDKIVALTDSASFKESRSSELEAELARVHTSLARLSQEKELVERHNIWLNDELTTKVNSLLELRKVHNELEADMSSKLADLERKYNDTSSSLKWKDDRVKELESKLEALQKEFCSSKDMAAATEERLSAELSTVNKLVELYKESSDEWSKKSGELEGVIKALETHASQVEKDYKDRLEKETSSRMEFEKEVLHLKEKLEKCEAELENCRNSDQLNLLQMSSFNTKAYGGATDANDVDGNNLMLVPSIPAGISGTALAASLLRDGWSLVKMYEKYQEAVDALRHEQLGRKQSQSILERVLHEIEDKAEVILDERAEHDRMVEAYDMLNEKLQHSISEQTALERTIQELKAELRRHKRDYTLAQTENRDLQRQITILLKECRDIQLRCGSADYDSAIEGMSSLADQSNVSSDADTVFSERLLTFKDINGLVEQNVQLRGLVRLLTEQIETKEVELKENFEKEFQKHSNETASKVDAVLARAEEQAHMIESLHTAVAMYKKLYEEEHRRHVSQLQSPDTAPADRRDDVMLLLEGSNDASKKAQEQAYERIKLLEEEMTGLRGEIITLRSQRDRSTLEATFAHEKLERFMKDFEHQREESNGIRARNVEFSQLIVDYQRKVREASEALHTAEDLSRKLNMEVSVVKREKEMLVNSEKRAFEEVRSLSERVHQLQATLNTFQSAEEVREEARSAQRINQEDHVKRTEREWAEAKKELQEERDNVRKLTHEHNTAMRGAMQRIEEMGKELASALRAVADANARASAAEERCSQLEKMKKIDFEINDELVPTSSTRDDMAVLHTAKEEVEKLRVEVQVNKDHMLQYKSIAQVNETALKQMEASHENFKAEAEKVKKSLEDELVSLKEQVNQLQDGYNLKAKELASASVSQEEALAFSLSEVSSLREECTSKMLRIEALESQMSALKDDLEKEHLRWRTAQDNYERQVILQSETIQELTKTSQALASLQEEASELRRVSDLLRIENEELKSKWETEKLVLEEAKDKAEKKYHEINEQNKILHDQLEALHIKVAEKSHGSGAESSGSVDKFNDAGLQNVVKYLRRSKEIAETEISLLKQEKLRLQSQLEGALKAEATAQGSLRAERENSRSVHFTEEEFKALQLQVREMNLLRESNVQLREENRHNFEECQKLRQSTHNTRMEVVNLENLLGERQNEVEACKREIEMQKKDRKDLEKRVDELLDKFRDIDPEDYGRMRADFQQMQVKLLDKDGQLEEVKKLVLEKQEVILRLEQDLARSKVEIDERESKISSISQTETSLKSDMDRQKRFFIQLKRRCDNLVKEKEELNKKNQELSKELADSNQVKRNSVDTAGEQATREKEEKDTRIQMLERTVEKLRDESREREEKDTRIQMLEKVVERLRDEVRKGKDEVRIEKSKNQKNEKGIAESHEKLKLADDLEKHKQALKTLSDEVEKLKHATESEGASTAQPHSGDSFDDLAAACLLAVENFEHVANQVCSEFGVPTTGDTLSVELGGSARATIGEVVPTAVASGTLASVVPAAQNMEESSKTPVTSKPKLEQRKVARRLVRPRIVKSDQPKGDVDMIETVGANMQSSVRKRPSALSVSEGQEGSHVRESSAADVAAPLIKKSRGSEEPQEGAEVQSVAMASDAPESFPSIAEEALGNGGDEVQLKEETADAGRDEDVETGEEQAVEDQGELQNDRSDIGEENMNRTAEIEVSEFQPKISEAEHAQKQQATGEAGSDPEEGEMVSDAIIGHEGGGASTSNNTSSAMIISNQEMGEAQLVEHQMRSPSPLPVEDEVADDALGDLEVSSPLLEDNEDKNEEGEIEVEETTPESSTDKLNNDGNDEGGSMAEEAAIDHVPTTAAAVLVPPVAEKTSNTSAMSEAGVANQDGSTLSSVSTSGPTEVKPEESVADTSSTTINLNERARLRSLQRLAGTLPSSPPVARGRGRTPRGRGRGGRTARGGQTPGSQGM